MSLGGTGSRDWIVQRFTAVILAIYTIALVFFLLKNPNFSYEAWKTLFSYFWMQVATLLALISIAFHAWIGLWIILTDYIKPIFLRYLFQGIILLVLFGYVLWGLSILWGK